MTTPDDSFQQLLVGEVRLMLLPLIGMFDSELPTDMFQEVLGWGLSSGVDPATDQAIRQIVAGVGELETLIDNPPQSLADIAAGLDKLQELWTAVRAVQVSPLPAGTLGRNIVEGLLLHHLQLRHPILHDILVLLTVVDPPAQIKLDQIGDLLSRPGAVLSGEYLGPGGLTADADAETIAGRLFPRLVALLGDLQLHAEYGTQPPPGPLPAAVADRIAGGLLWIYLQPDFGLSDRYGVTLALSPRERGGPGVIVLPWGQVSGFWDPVVDLQAAADGVLIGSGGVTLLGTSGGITSTPVIAEFDALVAGTSGGTHLETGAITLSAGLSLGHDDHEYRLAVDLGTVSLAVAGGDDDGLLASLLPADGMNVQFSLGLDWSNTGGLRFHGSAGLKATLPGASAGSTLSISAVDVSLLAADSAVVVQVTAAVTVAVGPVALTVAGVGLNGQLSFPPGGGNLGMADVGYGLATPTGIGLSIGAPQVTGGGFLSYDTASDRYSGALHVSVGGTIDIAAWGVLQRGSATQHWSLAVFLAGHIPPVELGFGFRLVALGGMVALHRRMDTDALRDAAAGVRGSLDDLLFPDHPETRLPQILASMDSFFPPAAGSYVAGPMAEVEWGRDGLVNARVRVALLLQLDEDKIAVYGSVQIGFPRVDHDTILRIRATLQALVDPGNRQALFSITIIEATLFSSIHLTGGAAFFTSWGPGRTTVFTAGGFHPAYRPFIPTGMTEPPRIGVHWNPVSAVKLDLTQYFAITSTSMQFGAAAHAEVGCDWGKVTGDLAFDFLVMTSPVMSMEADLSARVTVSVFGADVLSASLTGTLTGPGPWVLSGEVGWSLWMFDVSKSFRFEWGDPAPAAAAPQSAGEILAGELQAAGNWTSTRSGALPVRLRSGVHGPLAPGDEIQVQQSRLPFGTRVEAYEGTVLSDPGVWDLAASSASGIVMLGPVSDVFPERRFLAHPSADRPFRSGLACGARLVRTDWDVPGTAIGVDAAATDDVVLDGTSAGGPVTVPPPALEDAVAFSLAASGRLRSFAAAASVVEAGL